MTREKGGISRRARYWVGAAVCLLAVQAAWIHVDDLRTYDLSVGSIHMRATEIADQRRLVWEGNAFKDELHLGPLANVVSAIPLFFSRDVFFAYRLYLYLIAASWVLFYLACRRALGPGPGAWVGALAWAFLYFQLYVPERMLNSSFMPLFLPAYFYLLVEYSRRPRRILVPALWLSVGVLMNMNMSCMLLFFPTVAATVPWRSGRDAAVFVAGTAMVAGLHFHLIFQGFRMLADDSLIPFLAGGRSGGGVLGDLFVNLIHFAVLAPSAMGPALLVPSLIALCRPLEARPLEGQAVLMRASGWALVAAVALIPLLFTAKGGGRVRYSFFTTPFLCWLVGLWFRNLWERKEDPRRRLAWTILFFTVLVAFQGLMFLYYPWSQRHHCWNMTRLEGQVAVAERLSALILDRGLENVEVEEMILEREGLAWRLESRSSWTHAGLIPYLHPNLAHRVGKNGIRKILVLVTPAPDGPVPWRKPTATVEARYFHAAIYLDPLGVPPHMPLK